MDYVVFTDGGCESNPGRGSFGYVVIENKQTVYEHSTFFESETTNNRMELMGVIEALKFVVKNNHNSVHVLSDSEYVVKGITLWIGKWLKKGMKLSKKRDVMNKDLWMELYALCGLCKKLTFHLVKGHSGVYGNELVDSLCNEAIEAKTGSFLKRKLKSGESFFTRPRASFGFVSWGYAQIEPENIALFECMKPLAIPPKSTPKSIVRKQMDSMREQIKSKTVKV